MSERVTQMYLKDHCCRILRYCCFAKGHELVGRLLPPTDQTG